MKQTRTVSVLFLVVFLGLGVFSLSGCGKKPAIPMGIGEYYESIEVETGKITEYTSYVGYTHPAKETTLSTELPGVINQIAVKVGDSVQKGQLLTLVDTNEMDVNYQSASSSLEAFGQLENATSSTFDAQIEMAKNKVQQAKIAVDMAKVDGDGSAEKQLTQMKMQIDTLKTQLERAKSGLGTKEQQLYQNGVNTLLASKILLVNIGDFVDELLGISTEKQHLNDNFDVYLSAKNSNLKVYAKEQWRSLNTKYQKFVITLANIEKLEKTELLSGENKQLIYTTLQDDVALLEGTRTLLKTVYDAVDNSVDGVNLPMQQLNTWKQMITKMQADLEQLLLDSDAGTMKGVQGLLQNIDNFSEGETTEITLLNKQIALAEQQYLTMQDQSDKQYQIAEEQYKEAENALAMLQAQKESQLAQIHTQKTASLAQRNSALVQKNNARITAPFDAVILEKFVEIGQLVAPGAPIVRVGSEDLYQVSFAVPVKDIEKYSFGQKVQLSIIDLDKNYEGTIAEIAPIADAMTKKMSVKVDFSSQEDIPFGAYTKITIPLSTYIGVKIPVEYVYYQYGKAFAYVSSLSSSGAMTIEQEKTQQKNEQFEKRALKVSYCSDEECIVDGLELGTSITKKLK